MTTAINVTPRYRLTARQEAFCVNYFSGQLSATKAALKAGYSPKTAPFIAYENLKKPHIAERIADLQAGVASAKQMTERERREKLATIAREVHFLPVTAGDRIRAIDTLNKLDKLYSPEIPPVVPGSQVLNIIVVGGQDNLKDILAQVKERTKQLAIGEE